MIWKLVSDSSSDMVTGQLTSPAAEFEAVPLCLRVGQREFWDTAELSIPELLDAMAAEDCTPSYSQAVRMRNLFRCGDLDEKAIGEIMAEPKANQRERISLSAQDLRRFFPPAYTAQDMEQSILRMLEERTEAQQERPTHEAER